MTKTTTDLGTLDFAMAGEPFLDGSATGTTPDTLDYAKGGEPFYGAPPAGSGLPDTALVAELSMTMTTSASLTTAIALSASFTVDLTLGVLFINLGSSAKMEIIF
jgi:hypothetical protein